MAFALTWLTPAQRAEYETRLATGYHLSIGVTVMDLEERPIASSSPWVLEGQVNARRPAFDRDTGTIEVSRDLDMVLLDPTMALGFDSASPAAGAMYLDRMLQVTYGVGCSFGVVEVPVFTGPLVEVERQGGDIRILAQGKEVFGLGDANVVRQVPNSVSKAHAFMAMLRDMGEPVSNIDRPPGTARLVQPIAITRRTKYWFEAYRICRSIQGREPYYDGAGKVRTPRLSMTPVWTFREHGMLLAPPRVRYSTRDLANASRIIGHQPEGAPMPIQAGREADPDHPLSPASLGRHGVPRTLLAYEEDSEVRTWPAAEDRADEMLADGLAQVVSAEAVVAPVPHLDPWDLTVVDSVTFAGQSRINAMSLPLTPDSVMTLGFEDRVTRPTLKR